MNKISINKTILITGAVMALLAVLLGAFGAHGLKKLVDAEGIDSFTTGVRYQMYHAIICIILEICLFYKKLLGDEYFTFL